MKKLLHIQLLPLLTGAQNFSLHLLDGLPQDEFEISVASAPGGEFVEAVRSRGYNHISLSLLKHPISPLDLGAFIQIYLAIRRGGYDIVHANCSKIGLLGRIAARLAGTPLILYTVHGTSFQDHQSRPARAIFQALEWLGNRFGNKTVFVNNSYRAQALKLRLIEADKAVSIYNAIPPKFAAELDSLAADRRFDPQKQDFVLGSTLRFSPQKNVANLVGAACRACKLQPRLRFIFTGEGELLPLCRQIVRSHGLNGRVLFPGWDTRVADWLKLFDAFILYSRWEAQPFSIIEAMHSGLAVIGSAIPSIAELVDRDSGWLIELDDQEALIRCLVRLPENAAEAHAKGQHANRRIKALCDYRAMVESYLQIYREDGRR